MNRRDFFGAVGALGLAGGADGSAQEAPAQTGDAPLSQGADAEHEFDPTERSIAELSGALANNRTSAESLTRAYLRRIEALDRRGPTLGAVLALNPGALDAAVTLDVERRAGRWRGPLHGIPILLKDNIETLDPLPTTAGSLALATARHSEDAPVAARLRAAGAIVLAKGNLSEWANMRSPRSISGWSAVGGQTRNAYDRDRSPSGSSAGEAVAAAASLCAAAVGTETDGSVLAPAAVNGVVGLKPSSGLVSAMGIVPISARQDTAGPIARSVADAALLLSVMAHPAASWDGTDRLFQDLPQKLRIGVLPPPASAHPEVVRQSQDWFRALREEGVVLVDVDPPPAWPTMLDAELEVLLYEFKAAINAYLGQSDGRLPVRTLADLIEFNVQHAAAEMPFFGQELFEQAEALGPLTAPAYRKALGQLLHAVDSAGLGAIFATHQVAALVSAGKGPATLIDRVWGDRFATSGGWPPMASAAAVAGYPSLTVPAGFVAGLPVGIAFVAPRLQDGLLLQIGRVFERSMGARRPPHFDA